MSTGVLHRNKRNIDACCRRDIFTCTLDYCDSPQDIGPCTKQEGSISPTVYQWEWRYRITRIAYKVLGKSGSTDCSANCREKLPMVVRFRDESDQRIHRHRCCAALERIDTEAWFAFVGIDIRLEKNYRLFSTWSELMVSSEGCRPCWRSGLGFRNETVRRRLQK